ncbi:unnamed protein product, partial [Phaeothamnion confervicola]
SGSGVGGGSGSSICSWVLGEQVALSGLTISVFPAGTSDGGSSSGAGDSSSSKELHLGPVDLTVKAFLTLTEEADAGGASVAATPASSGSHRRQRRMSSSIEVEVCRSPDVTSWLRRLLPGLSQPRLRPAVPPPLHVSSPPALLGRGWAQAQHHGGGCGDGSSGSIPFGLSPGGAAIGWGLVQEVRFLLLHGRQLGGAGADDGGSAGTDNGGGAGTSGASHGAAAAVASVGGIERNAGAGADDADLWWDADDGYSAAIPLPGDPAPAPALPKESEALAQVAVTVSVRVMGLCAAFHAERSQPDGRASDAGGGVCVEMGILTVKAERGMASAGSRGAAAATMATKPAMTASVELSGIRSWQWGLDGASGAFDGFGGVLLMTSGALSAVTAPGPTVATDATAADVFREESFLVLQVRQPPAAASSDSGGNAPSGGRLLVHLSLGGLEVLASPSAAAVMASCISPPPLALSWPHHDEAQAGASGVADSFRVVHRNGAVPAAAAAAAEAGPPMAMEVELRVVSAAVLFPVGAGSSRALRVALDRWSARCEHPGQGVASSVAPDATADAAAGAAAPADASAPRIAAQAPPAFSIDLSVGAGSVSWRAWGAAGEASAKIEQPEQTGDGQAQPPSPVLSQQPALGEEEKPAAVIGDTCIPVSTFGEATLVCCIYNGYVPSNGSAGGSGHQNLQEAMEASGRSGSGKDGSSTTGGDGGGGSRGREVRLHVRLPRVDAAISCSDVVEASWALGRCRRRLRPTRPPSPSPAPAAAADTTPLLAATPLVVVYGASWPQNRLTVVLEAAGGCLQILPSAREPRAGLGQEVLSASMPWGVGIVASAANGAGAVATATLTAAAMPPQLASPQNQTPPAVRPLFLVNCGSFAADYDVQKAAPKTAAAALAPAACRSLSFRLDSSSLEASDAGLESAKGVHITLFRLDGPRR